MKYSSSFLILLLSCTFSKTFDGFTVQVMVNRTGAKRDQGTSRVTLAQANLTTSADPKYIVVLLPASLTTEFFCPFGSSLL